MPKLNCAVELCKYQKGGLCSAGSIDIGGATANSTQETSCSTFVPEDAAFSNSNHEPQEEIYINCGAENCVHNNYHACNADHINVDGNYASTSDATACASFLTK